MYILGITHTHTHTYTQQTNKCDRTYNPLLILCSAHTVRFAHTAQWYAVTQTIIVPVLLHLLHLLCSDSDYYCTSVVASAALVMVLC